MKTSILVLLAVVSIASAQFTMFHGHPPSFALDDSAKRKLIEKAITLRAGDSFETITNLLGKPSLNLSFDFKKEGRTGHALRYDAVVWEQGKSNEGDQFISIELDERDRLRILWIHVMLR